MALTGLALLAGSVALYAPSLAFGFVGYDDASVLLAHPNLFGQASLWACLREIVVGYFPREEPLLVRDLSWLLDARLFGFGNPSGYHLGNILLHATDVVLVFAFLLHATRRLGFAALAAGVFASLAVHVEPVCWVMGRKDVLGAFFVLLSLLLQSIELRHADVRVRRALAVAVFLLFPIAVLAKFSAIVLLPVLAVHRLLAPYLDGSRGPTEAFPWGQWARSLPGYLPHLLVGIGLHRWYQRILAAYQIVGGFAPPALSATHLKTLAELVPQSIAGSLGRMFWAAEHSISYLRPNVAITPTAGELALGFATLAGWLAVLVWSFRYRRDLSFWVVAFVAFLMPYFNLEYVGIWAADRYSYLASVPVVALLVMPIARAWSGHRVAVRAGTLVATAALLVLVGYEVVAGRAHQPAFRDGLSLWTYETHLARPSIQAYQGYAGTLFDEATSLPPGSAAEREKLEAAVAAAREGIRYYATIPWRPAPGYVARERIHLARLFSVLASAAELAGVPLEQQLELHRAAFNVAPADEQTEALARILFTLAAREPHDLEKARESLHHFRDHVAFASRDPTGRGLLRAQLRRYGEVFPELRADAGAIEAQLLP